MDLLFASEVLEPAIGGAERTMLEWAQGLSARGHAVRTVCLAPATRPPAEEYWRWRARQRAAIGELVAEAIASRRPDAVVAQLHGAPAALAAAAELGVSGVLALPSYEGLCKLAFVPASECPPRGDCASCPAAGRLAPAERAALLQARRAHDGALSAAAARVVPSRAMAATVRQWSGRGATVVWPVGPDLPPPGHATPDGPVVCAAARWAPHKGAGLLPALVAASRGPSARAVDVIEAGLSDPERDAIRAAGATLVPRAPVDELFAGASLVLVPSQWEEPFGRIAWEALARGVPVLASDAGGLADFVPTGSRVVPRDDPAAWQQAIDRLLGDPRAWSAASADGRRAAARLLSPPPIDRLEALLASVADTSGRRVPLADGARL